MAMREMPASSVSEPRDSFEHGAVALARDDCVAAVVHEAAALREPRLATPFA